MKYYPLIIANLLRKKVRTFLTIGSFAVALFLFGLLVAIRSAFNGGVDVAGADRLVVINKVSIIQPLPASYREKIQRLAGVKAVTFATWFGGIYQDERNFFPQFAVDPESYHAMYPEFVIPDDQWRAFIADRQGCIVGAGTAKRFGWKIGDHIPIKGTYLQGLWEFNLRGIYTAGREADDTTQFWFQQDYLEERGDRYMKGLVGWYVVRVDDPQSAAKVVAAIDNEFANSPWETKTETEKNFAASFAKQMGNIELLILSIGAVVFFTLLLVTGNTMAMAVRERTGEIAVLKTIGFGDRKILGLVLVEPVILALVGGILGILGAKAISPGLAKALPGLVFALPATDLAKGVVLSLAIGLLSGFLPGFSAMRLRVVDALRKV